MPVWVSSAESPDEFFIQFKSDEEGLQKLSRNLNDTLNHSSVKIDKTELREGMNRQMQDHMTSLINTFFVAYH